MATDATTLLFVPEDWHEAVDHRRRLARGINQLAKRVRDLEANQATLLQALSYVPQDLETYDANFDFDPNVRLASMDVTSQHITCTLPDLSTYNPLRVFEFTFKHTGTVTTFRGKLTPTGSDTVNGANATFNLPLTNHGSVTIIPNVDDLDWAIQDRFNG